MFGNHTTCHLLSFIALIAGDLAGISDSWGSCPRAGAGTPHSSAWSSCSMAGLISHVSPSRRSNRGGTLEPNQRKVRIRPSYSGLQSHFSWERASLITLPQRSSSKGRVQGVPWSQSLQLFSARFTYTFTLLRRFCRSITTPIGLQCSILYIVESLTNKSLCAKKNPENNSV